MSSKRSAFRYKCDDNEVIVKTATDDGRALLSDISTNGCAIKSLDVPVFVGEKCLISFSLPEKEGNVEMQAEVVRIDGEKAGAKYILCEDETRTFIRKYFSKQQKTPIK